MDWAPGDKALCVATAPAGVVLEPWEPQVGSVYTVIDVDFNGRDVLLDLAEDPYAGDEGFAWNAERFRKIRPDEHQACEAEFITLLKRSKQKEPV